MADLKYKATAERVWLGKKKARAFARAMCQNAEMIEVSNRRLARIGGHDDRSCFQTKGSKVRRIILSTSPPNLC
jgi:hypothetical protein